MAGITANALLRKPFYLPELQAVMKLMEGFDPKDSQSAAGAAHLSEQKVDGFNLKEILSSAGADGLVLLQSGKLIEAIGGLRPEAAQEVSATIVGAWQPEQSGDLIRFVKLETVNQEKLLYVTVVNADLLLGLIFPNDSSITRARALARQVAKFWKTTEPIVTASSPPKKQKDSLPIPETDYRQLSEQQMVITEETEEEPHSSMGEVGAPTNMKEAVVRLLEAVGSPSPDPQVNHLDPGEPPFEDDFRYPWEINGQDDNLTKTPPKNAINPPDGSGTSGPKLAYTCILIPNEPTQNLTGELAGELEQWVPQFCENLGWTLEKLEIHPQRLQWTIQVGPGSSAGQLVRILRQQSSRRLAERFPDLMIIGGLNDFWAPGYLIVSGRATPAQNLIDDYIQQTRRRQGKNI